MYDETENEAFELETKPTVNTYRTTGGLVGTIAPAEGYEEPKRPLGLEYEPAFWIKTADDEAVNHPQHYNSHPSGVECIEIVRHMTFNVGNVFKYLWRSGLKDGEPVLKDFKKALWYLEDEIKRLEAEK